MISGIDVEMRTLSDETSVEVSIRAIRQFWPKAVFADAFTGERYNDFRDIPFGTTDELFVYRDIIAADAWVAEGAIPALSNTMIHVIRDPGYLTAVIDKRDSMTESILAGIKSALDNDIFVVFASLAA